MKTIHEEKANQHRAQYVEVVSTYRGDDSDLLSETRLKNNAFSNESIIVWKGLMIKSKILLQNSKELETKKK